MTLKRKLQNSDKPNGFKMVKTEVKQEAIESTTEDIKAEYFPPGLTTTSSVPLPPLPNPVWIPAPFNLLQDTGTIPASTPIERKPCVVPASFLAAFDTPISEDNWLDLEYLMKRKRATNFTELLEVIKSHDKEAKISPIDKPAENTKSDKIESDHSELQEKYIKLETEWLETRKECQRLRNRNIDNDEDIYKKEKKLDRQSGTLRLWKRNVENYERELSYLQTQLKSASAENSRLAARLKVDRDNEERYSKRLKKERDNLARTAEILEARLKAQSRSNELKEAGTSKLEHQLKTLRAENDVVNHELKLAKVNSMDTQAHNMALRSEMNRIQTQLQALKIRTGMDKTVLAREASSLKLIIKTLKSGMLDKDNQLRSSRVICEIEATRNRQSEELLKKTVNKCESTVERIRSELAVMKDRRNMMISCGINTRNGHSISLCRANVLTMELTGRDDENSVIKPAVKLEYAASTESDLTRSLSASTNGLDPGCWEVLSRQTTHQTVISTRSEEDDPESTETKSIAKLEARPATIKFHGIVRQASDISTLEKMQQ